MKKLYLLPFLFFIALTSCREANDDPVPVVKPPVENENKPPCLLISQIREGDSYTTSTAFDYDASSRLKTAESGSFTSTYERNREGKINKIVYRKGTEVTGHADIEIDSQGRWVKVTRSDNTLITELEYDSQGKLIASTFTSKIGEIASVRQRTFEYKDGDLYRETMTLDEDLTEITEYEYYADKPAVDIEYDSINALLWGQVNSSQNLLKKVTTTRPSEERYSVVDNITYELNEKGYPTLTTFLTVHAGNYPTPTEYTSTLTQSYSCE